MNIKQIKQMALPAEHGGWGLLSEALLIGLCLAPSPAGFFLALTALFFFLLYQPVKTAWTRYDAGAVFTRPPYEWIFIFLYGGLAWWTFDHALDLTDRPFWIVGLAVAPIFLIQLAAMVQKQGRKLFPELAGAVALCSAAPMILIAGGWGMRASGFVWILLGTRILCSILFIRNFLFASKGKPFSRTQPKISYALSAVLLLSLAVFQKIPYLAFLGFLLLMTRAFLLSRRFGQPFKAKTLGWQEVASGLANTVLILLGYRLGL